MNIIQPSVELLSITPNASKLIELAGRTCYKSEEKITECSADPFVEKIAHVYKHESVLEHATATFRIITDRGISHELVRHRLASYSQESTRYVNYGNEKNGGGINVIEPPGLQDESPEGYNGSRIVWQAAMRLAEDAYLKLIALGVKPQIARSVLPTCTKTEVIMTANFREWLHVIKMRTAENAHPQIREVIGKVQEILAGECPVLFAKKGTES